MNLVLSAISSPRAHTSFSAGGLTRILTVVVGLAFVVGYYAWRWKRAGDAADAMRREDDAIRAWHQALLNHPAWGQLQAVLASHGFRVVAGPPAPGQVQVELLTLNNALGMPVGPSDPGAVTMSAYCRGEKKIVASLWLDAGHPPSVREPVFGEWPRQAG